MKLMTVEQVEFIKTRAITMYGGLPADIFPVTASGNEPEINIGNLCDDNLAMRAMLVELEFGVPDEDCVFRCPMCGASEPCHLHGCKLKELLG